MLEMAESNGGHIGGFFAVFLLVTLVAMLSVASLVMQISTLSKILKEDSDNGDSDGQGLGGEPNRVQEIRDTLAMLQPDNGEGPPINNVIEEFRYGYSGDDRVWVLAFYFYLQNNLAYFDETTGKYGGYQVDVANAVCKRAGKNCRLVVTDLSCWETDPDIRARGGPGLHAGWFDACVGFSPTFTRSLVFDFTQSISPQASVHFYTLPGNPRNFDWKDLRGKKIGFRFGWYTDAECVARNAGKIQGADLDSSQRVIFDRPDDLVKAVQNGEVDAAFALNDIEDISDLEPVSDNIQNCALGGDALMVRKNSELQEWWDPAFRTVLGSREYREICRDVDNYYSTFLPGSSSEFVCRAI